MTEGSTSECESINALCRRVVRRQMEESNEHPLVSSRIPYEYATHIRTLYINTRDSYHYKHARCNVMHRKCTVSVRGSNPPHTVNSPLQPTRRTTTEPCNENPDSQCVQKYHATRTPTRTANTRLTGGLEEACCGVISLEASLDQSPL